jgi:hypothetical protein
MNALAYFSLPSPTRIELYKIGTSSEFLRIFPDRRRRCLSGRNYFIRRFQWRQRRMFRRALRRRPRRAGCRLRPIRFGSIACSGVNVIKKFSSSLCKMVLLARFFRLQPARVEHLAYRADSSETTCQDESLSCCNSDDERGLTWTPGRS